MTNGHYSKRSAQPSNPQKVSYLIKRGMNSRQYSPGIAQKLIETYSLLGGEVLIHELKDPASG